MKVAVFSDVHGNAIALHAVLQDIEAQRPDRIICGGDLAFGGPEPEAAVARISALGIPCIRGNTDEWLTPDASRTEAIVAWTRAALSEESRHYLGGLPFDYRLGDLLVVHATPWSVFDLVPKDAGQAMLRRVLAEARAAAVVYGHIHIAWIGTVAGAGLVVNTGSVGFPFDGDPRSSYALLQQGASGWTVEIRRVPYDIERASAAFPPDHPDRAGWAARMRTGRQRP